MNNYHLPTEGEKQMSLIALRERLREPAEKQRRLAQEAEDWLAERADRLLPMIAALEALDVTCELEVSGDPCINVRFTGDKQKFTAVLRELRTRQWNTNDPKDRPKPGVTFWSSWFYDEAKPGDSTTKFWLSFSSNVCRRVKVGTKIVPQHEEDVYEVVCGEIEPYAAAATGAVETAAAPADDGIPF